MCVKMWIRVNREGLVFCDCCMGKGCWKIQHLEQYLVCFDPCLKSMVEFCWRKFGNGFLSQSFVKDGSNIRSI